MSSITRIRLYRGFIYIWVNRKCFSGGHERWRPCASRREPDICAPAYWWVKVGLRDGFPNFRADVGLKWIHMFPIIGTSEITTHFVRLVAFGLNICTRNLCCEHFKPMGILWFFLFGLRLANCTIEQLKSHETGFRMHFAYKNREREVCLCP